MLPITQHQIFCRRYPLNSEQQNTYTTVNYICLGKSSFLNCFALKTLMLISYYATLRTYVQSKFLFHTFSCLLLCLHTQVHLLSEVHKMTETTSQLRKISHTSPHPYFSALRKQNSSSQLLVDFNCQQQPHVSSSLHPLMSSDKLRRETHPLVTFYLLHFTSHAHTVQYKNSSVIHILFAGNTQARLPQYYIIYFPMAQQTHKKKKTKRS